MTNDNTNEQPCDAVRIVHLETEVSDLKAQLKEARQIFCWGNVLLERNWHLDRFDGKDPTPEELDISAKEFGYDSYANPTNPPLDIHHQLH